MKVFYGELQEGNLSALNVARRNATNKPSKSLLRISTYQWGLWNRLQRSDQSGKVASTKEQLSVKKKRICEAERKRRERRANTNGPPADSMTLTCSSCD